MVWINVVQSQSFGGNISIEAEFMAHGPGGNKASIGCNNFNTAVVHKMH